jgi:hypothetical protein
MWGSSLDRPVDEILADPEVRLQELVSATRFWPEYRNGNAYALDFILRPETIREILSVVFDLKRMDQEEDKRILFLYMDVLTTGPPRAAAMFARDEHLISILRDCLTEENVLNTNSKMCGFFGRLLSVFVKITNGAFLDHFPSLCDFIARNITSYGCRTLFFDLFSERRAFFGSISDFCLKFLGYADTRLKVFYALCVIRDLVNTNPDVLAELESPQIMEAIMRIAADPHQLCWTSLQALQLAGRILWHHGDIELREIVDGFADSFECIIDVNDCRMSILLLLYKRRIHNHVDMFMTGTGRDFISHAFVNVVKSLPSTELASFLETGDVIPKLIQNFRQSQVNGHLIALAKVLNERKNDVFPLQTPEWSEFFESRCMPRVRVAERSYGGLMPLAQTLQMFFPLVASSSDGSSSSGSGSDEEENGEDGESRSKSQRRLRIGLMDGLPKRERRSSSLRDVVPRGRKLSMDDDFRFVAQALGYGARDEPNETGLSSSVFRQSVPLEMRQNGRRRNANDEGLPVLSGHGTCGGVVEENEMG